MIDDYFHSANLQPNIIMELSRQETINQMVENNLGVGTAGAKTIAPCCPPLSRGAELRHEKRAQKTGPVANPCAPAPGETIEDQRIVGAPKASLASAARWVAFAASRSTR